jgi:hypothetical protein
MPWFRNACERGRTKQGKHRRAMPTAAKLLGGIGLSGASSSI